MYLILDWVLLDIEGKDTEVLLSLPLLGRFYYGYKEVSLVFRMEGKADHPIVSCMVQVLGPGTRTWEVVWEAPWRRFQGIFEMSPRQFGGNSLPRVGRGEWCPRWRGGCRQKREPAPGMDRSQAWVEGRCTSQRRA